MGLQCFELSFSGMIRGKLQLRCDITYIVILCNIFTLHLFQFQMTLHFL